MQANATPPQEMPEVQAIVNTRVIFPDASVLQSVEEELRSSSPTYQAALAELQTRNLKVSADAAPPFGWTIVDESVLGTSVQSLTFVQDLGSVGGIDHGLIGVVVSGTDENGEPIRKPMFELVQKPSAGVTDPADIRVVATFRDGGALTPGVGVASILSRFVKCVTNGCAQSCLNSLVACAGVFPLYLKCVAVACGGCALKCGACAACDCSFWCKWGVGCCED